MAGVPEDKCKSYHHTTTGLVIHVVVGDITACKVDAIACSTNNWLNPAVGGMAKAIARRGGSALVDECRVYIGKYRTLSTAATLVTTAGNLPCQKVVHVVGPRRDDYRSEKECADVLKKAFDNILEETQRNNFKTVAIPGVSAGLYGVPLKVVANCTFQSINDFYENRRKPSLQEIKLVDKNDNMVHCWQLQIDKLVKDGSFCSISPSDDRSKGMLSYVVDAAKYFLPRIVTNILPTNDPLVAAAHEPVEVEPEVYCCICMCTATDPKTLDKCKHTFCRECIERGFKVKPACPVCGEIYGKVTGNQPKDGQMMTRIDRSITLPGYESYDGAIVIEYRFPNGIQTEEHSNPGRPYRGTSRVAYLPNNMEGNRILELLKRAFDARLIFTVGVSRTTGQENTVTWNDIHHKTRVSGGSQRFGYPDPTYLSRVKDELAAKGIK